MVHRPIHQLWWLYRVRKYQPCGPDARLLRPRRHGLLPKRSSCDMRATGCILHGQWPLVGYPNGVPTHLQRVRIATACTSVATCTAVISSGGSAHAWWMPLSGQRRHRVSGERCACNMRDAHPILRGLHPWRSYPSRVPRLVRRVQTSAAISGPTPSGFATSGWLCHPSTCVSANATHTRAVVDVAGHFRLDLL